LRIAAFRLARDLLTERVTRETATAEAGVEIFGGARPKGDCDDRQ
jgi:hypothetical protein